MGTLNNLFNIKLNSVNGTASVNYGNAINVGAEAISKAAGGFAPIGDLCQGMDFEQNAFIDPDVNDAQRIGL